MQYSHIWPLGNSHKRVVARGRDKLTYESKRWRGENRHLYSVVSGQGVCFRRTIKRKDQEDLLRRCSCTRYQREYEADLRVYNATINCVNGLSRAPKATSSDGMCHVSLAFYPLCPIQSILPTNQPSMYPTISVFVLSFIDWIPLVIIYRFFAR